MMNYKNSGLSGPILVQIAYWPLAHCLRRYRQWVLFPAFFLAFQAIVFAQHNLILYNMREVPQSNALNPGQLPLMKGFFGFPLLSGIQVGAGNSGFSFQQGEMAYRNDFYDFDFDGLRQSLKSDINRMLVDNEIRLLSWGSLIGKSYLSVDISQVTYFSGTIPQDVLNLLHDIQQYSFLPQAEDKSYDLSRLDLNGASYRSFSIGYAKPVRPNLSVGGRVRYLQGFVGARTENEGLKFRYPGEGDDFQVDGQMSFLLAGYNGLIETIDNGQSEFFLQGSGNNGFAIDFGGVYQLNDRIELSFSAVNLGRIMWKKDVNHSMAVGEQLAFSATDPEDYFESWADIADNLVSGEAVDDQENFTTSLPQRYYIGGNYHFGSSGSVGLLINPVRHKGVTDASVSLLGNLRAGTFLGLSAALTHNRYHSFSLGAGLSLNLLGLQIYAVSDHLLAAFNWKNARGMQAQFGINFTFGRMRREAAAPREEQLASLPEKLLQKEKAEKPVSRKKDTVNTQPEVVQVPAGPSLPKAAETPAVTAQPVNSRFFTLSGTVRSAENGEVLKGIAVEAYKIVPQGRNELAYRGSFFNGNLEIPLSRGFSHQIVVSRQGFEPEEIFLEATRVADNEAEVTFDFVLQSEAALPTTPVPVVPEPKAPDLVATPVPLVSEPEAPDLSAAPVPVVPESEAPALATAPPTPSPAASTVAAAPAKKATSPSPDLGVYRLTGSTSLRRGPSHTADVLLRFKEGDRVNVLEKTDDWWWKVNFRGQIGYVKVKLLTR